MNDFIPRLSLSSIRELLKIIVLIRKDMKLDDESDVERRQRYTIQCAEPEHLFPAGNIIYFNDGVFYSVKHDGFNQVNFNSKMLADHMPIHYTSCLDKF
jgi:hypothetical protein